MSLETKPNRTTYQWRYADTPAPREVDGLLDRYGKLHPVIAKLLVSKGLVDEESITAFFSTSLSTLKKAGKMHGQTKAAERLIEAINKREKIRLYGDYDVDGTSSVALMSAFLHEAGARFDYYIPDRYAEGYGLSEAGIASAEKCEVDLLITLDCGIRAVEGITKLKDAGIETIVCDHHETGDVLPPAFAILNPKQDACSYSGKELCGCGVALILVLEVLEITGWDFDSDRYFELAAIATCSDIVPITGVNRAIVNKGLEVISNNPGHGVKALLDLSNHSGRAVSVSDVVFKIAPRINAAGRMDHAGLGVELFTSPSMEEAYERAENLEKLNAARKDLDKRITEEAMDVMVEGDPDRRRFTTVVAKAGWHKGVIGIVASRLMEVYHRPTVVLTEADRLYTGSARSVDGFNLHEVLEECSDLLVKFGGHAAAAGLTLKPENLSGFMDRFESIGARELKGSEGQPELDVSLVTPFEEWHNDGYLDFYRQLLRFKPFGPSNLPPVFATEGCLADQVKIVGKDHLKFSVYCPGNPNRLQAIAFNQADKYEDLASGTPFSLAYVIGENTWNGTRSLQLEVKDIKI